MKTFISLRSLWRLAAVLVAVGASVVLAVQTTPPVHAATGCEPTANVPRYNSFPQWAQAAGYVRCGGYYEIKLVTSTGTTLSKRSGYYTSPLTVYTNWVSCPSGTVVHSYVYEKANVQGNTSTYTATSASFVCP